MIKLVLFKHGKIIQELNHLHQQLLENLIRIVSKKFKVLDQDLTNYRSTLK
jgi:hypothetical protein